MVMAGVKEKSKRAQKARQTRLRMLEAARDLFVANGYGATTLQEVADRAGVAVQTIYFTFGNKRTLLKELVDTAIAGDDEPAATTDRPWFADAMASDTAFEHLRRHVAGTREVLERFAPITSMVTIAVATDASVAELWPDDTDLRHTVQSTAARSLMGKPGARPDVSVDEASDQLYALLSPELYLLCVRNRGWPVDRWQQWVHKTLRHQLCTD
jgi:AcrR family transcriptional regulator